MVQHYGPKMRALHSDRQRAFVIELSKQSKQNQTAAYRAAGFGNNTKADTGNANVLAGRQDIIDALSEVMEGKSKLSVPAAMARLNKVIESGKGDPHTFVMAGFIARAEEWAAFEVDWNEVTGGVPFHMVDAAAAKDFDRIRALFEVIGTGKEKSGERKLNVPAWMQKTPPAAPAAPAAEKK